MNAKKFSDAMSELDNKYIDEALNYKKKVKKPIWIKWGAMVASLLLVFTMSVPALAAADFGPAYNLLYKVSPAIAQKLKPVSMSCEDNGIKFEVISAYVEGSEAKIFISVQDIDGDRIDETTDFFDSFSINTPYSIVLGIACDLTRTFGLNYPEIPDCYFTLVSIRWFSLTSFTALSTCTVYL